MKGDAEKLRHMEHEIDSARVDLLRMHSALFDIGAFDYVADVTDEPISNLAHNCRIAVEQVLTRKIDDENLKPSPVNGSLVIAYMPDEVKQAFSEIAHAIYGSMAATGTVRTYREMIVREAQRVRAMINDINTLVERDAPWAAQTTRDPVYRVYYVLCALLCRMDMGRQLSEMTPALLSFRDSVADIDDERIKAFCALVDGWLPRTVNEDIEERAIVTPPPEPTKKKRRKRKPAAPPVDGDEAIEIEDG
jgi:hypothetical protein